VEDVAAALIEAAKNDDIAGFTFNVGSDFEISVKDVVKKILETAGLPSKIEYIKNRPGDVSRLYADSTKFRKTTGWKPKTTFENGLIKTIEWFKSRPEDASVLLSQEKGINWE
jgi:UDP-glucose 4-epimerase